MRAPDSTEYSQANENSRLRASTALMHSSWMGGSAHLVLPVHPFYIDLQMQLSHAADNSLSCLRV